MTGSREQLDVSVKPEYTRIRRKMIFASLAPIAIALAVFFFYRLNPFMTPFFFITVPYTLALILFYYLLFSLTYLPFVFFKDFRMKAFGFIWFLVTFFMLYLLFHIKFGGWEYYKGQITISRNATSEMSGIFVLGFVWLVVRATLIFDKCDSQSKAA